MSSLYSRASVVAITLVLSIVSAGSTAPANAADLFIAGTIGEVYKGDSQTGDFTLFGGACLGPIQGLGLGAADIYAGDETGAVLRFDLATGEFMDRFDLPAGVSAIVIDGTDLLVSESAGTIRRVDSTSGLIESTLASPIGIEAMLLIGNDLFIAGATGDVWKGDSTTGGFLYFGCACAGTVQALANDDANLFAGDNFGQFIRYDLVTGTILGEGFLPFDVTAMVMDGEELLISDSEGNVHRVDPITGAVTDTLNSPINIQAMVISESGQPIPTVSEWGAILLALSLLTSGSVVLAKRGS